MSQKSSDELKDLGNAAFKVKKYMDALNFYQQAVQIETDPKKLAILMSNAAQTCLELGRYISTFIVLSLFQM
jgi:hypothetical protein